MNNLTKSVAVGLTALSLTSALFAGISHASERHGIDHVRGVRDEGHRGGYGRDIATGLAVDVGLALISNAIAEREYSHPRTTGHYIGDDAKPGKTQEKPKVAACTWRLADISVESYDTETESFIRGKTTKETDGWKKILDKLTDKAKKFVTEHAGKKWNMWFEIAAYSVHQLHSVFITYACVDDAGKTVATKIVPLEDTENMNWWAGAANTGEQQQSVRRHLPHTPPVVEAKK